jgi:hypothetical protein
MMKKNRHIIQKLQFELKTGGNAQSTGQIADRVSSLIRNSLTEELEQLFSEISGDQHLVIGRMEVDLGSLTEAEFEKKMIHMLRNQLLQIQHKSLQVSSKAIQTNSEGKKINLLWYYLEKGRRPWNVSSAISSREFTEEIRRSFHEILDKNPEQLKQFLLARIDDSNVIDRTHSLLSTDFDRLVRKLTPTISAGGLDFYKYLIKKMRGVSERQVNRAFIRAVLLIGDENNLPLFALTMLLRLYKSSAVKPDIPNTGKSGITIDPAHQKMLDQVTGLFKKLVNSERISRKELKLIFDGQSDLSAYFLTFNESRQTGNLQQILYDFFTKSGSEPSLENWQKSQLRDKDSERKESSTKDDDTVFMVKNAGIILFWPFMEKLFKNIELIYRGNFIDEQARQKAILLLNYISYGETAVYEDRLVLNKFLCGYPVNNSVTEGIELSESEKNECHLLINQVIGHWAILKNSSETGLRNSFIKRTGRLELKEKKCSLTIERISIDILIDRIPWPISIVKLPWMEKNLTVEW